MYFEKTNNFEEKQAIKSQKMYERGSGEEAVLTIAIPTYKRGDFLLQAIESLNGFNGIMPFEVIVVDNDPDSCGWEIAANVSKAGNFVYYRNVENIGMFGNWNRCIELAKGKWVSILNDDDMLSPSWMCEVADFINRDCPQMISCESNVLDDSTGVIKHRDGIRNIIIHTISRVLGRNNYSRTIVDYFISSPNLGSLGIAFRKDLALDIGGFSISDFPISDWVFFAKYARNFGEIHINTSCSVYRIGQNESRSDLVRSGWVNKGFQFRREIASEIFGLNCRMGEFLSNLLTAKHYFDIRRAWGDFEGGRNFVRNLGMPDFVGGVMLRFFVNVFLLFRQIKCFWN